MENLNNDRPDPDELVKAILEDENKKNIGRLYLFLGMAPGVGKTYAMLQAAKEALKDGVDVVIGVVETHGRHDTEELIKEIPIIPKRQIAYRNIDLYEMDLDAILKRKPKIVLVDELAHTNVPGSRHNKRYQDVFEILNEGIDVFSTLNIQHLESRKEIVEKISNISIYETIPDNILDKAFQIRLIDLSVTDLLKRLKEGKVYLGEHKYLAASNFFQKENLTALREISLRVVADKVDNDLKNLTQFKTIKAQWSVSEKLLVIIDETKRSEYLIRLTRKLAYSLDAPWIALYLNTGRSLNEEEKNNLIKNLEFAKSLGAETIEMVSLNKAETIVQFAQKKNITQIILDPSFKSNPFQLIIGGSLYKDLIKITDNISILLAPKMGHKKNYFNQFLSYFSLRSSFFSYIKSLLFIFCLTLFNHLLLPFWGYRSAGFIFLLGIMVAGIFLPLGPMLFFSLLSILLWDYYFIQPLNTFIVANTEDLFMGISFVFSAFCIGIMTNRMKRREKLLFKQEYKNRILYEISWALSKSTNKNEMISVVIEKLSKNLPGNCDIAIKKDSNLLRDYQYIKFESIEKEMAVANWSLKNNKAAGWSTDTLSLAQALHIPINGSKNSIGVLAFKPDKKAKLEPQDLDLLLITAEQIGQSLEREILIERAHQIAKLKEIEKQQNAILKFIIDELRSLLITFENSLKSLTDPLLNEQKKRKTSDIGFWALEKFSFVIENLSIMSRIIAGIYPLNKGEILIEDLITLAKNKISRSIGDQKINIRISKDIPKVLVDISLVVHSLSNILLNAVTYNPKNMPIEIDVCKIENEIVIKISDNGPGIAQKYLNQIFDRFYRIPGSLGKGVGLGLAIAKGVIKAHGGKINAQNKPDETGAIFTLTIPLSPADNL